MKNTYYNLTLILLFSLGLFLMNNTILDIKELSKKNSENLEYICEALKPNNVVKATITAYSATESECDSDPTITASMRKVRPGTVAVSRDLFNKGWTFGGKIYIKSLGVYEINDLMHERYKNRVDVFIGDTVKARKFGVKKDVIVALLKI